MTTTPRTYAICTCGSPIRYQRGLMCRECYCAYVRVSVPWHKTARGIAWKREYMKTYNREYKQIKVGSYANNA